MNARDFDAGGGRTIDERIFENMAREWGYQRGDHPDEGTGEQIRCCDCHQPFREPPTEGFRKLRLPASWAKCLTHPGYQHHAVCL